ncbi:hypothetical protein GW17_00052034, partial [Ensete ventricosum]
DPQAKAGLCFYWCKTWDRCFPSFQALGGHRSSNMKPKPVLTSNSTTTSVSTGGNKPRAHECSSICGSEFSTGQVSRRPHAAAPAHNSGRVNRSQEEK